MSSRDRNGPRSGAPHERFDASTEHEPSLPDAALESAPPAGSRIYLLVRRDDGETTAIEIDAGAEVTVGRSPAAAVSVVDARVSREHTSFVRRGDALAVRDLGSRNGTLVNGRRLRAAEQRLRGGDLVRVGSVEIAIAESASGLAGDAVSSERSPSRDGALQARERGNDGAADEAFIVADPAMVKVFDLVRRVAVAPTTVLVTGETGVGKEIVAEQIHRWSPRRRGPLVRINCAAIAESMLESELFGHARAAFTGAERAKEGFFEAAHTGTLLLDEIGEMSLAMQAKLLRVLETRSVLRLGETRERPIDVRVVCATHRDIDEAVRAGRFRQDLLFRIASFRIEIPPLRERPTEIQLLATAFAERFARRFGRPTVSVAADAMAALTSYVWPGNVRELRGAIEHAVLMADERITSEHLPTSVVGVAGALVRRPASHAPEASGATVDANAMRGRVADLERVSIEAALAAAAGNRSRAAEKLGISRGALAYKMTKYKIR